MTGPTGPYNNPGSFVTSNTFTGSTGTSTIGVTIPGTIISISSGKYSFIGTVYATCDNTTGGVSLGIFSTGTVINIHYSFLSFISTGGGASIVTSETTTTNTLVPGTVIKNGSSVVLINGVISLSTSGSVYVVISSNGGPAYFTVKPQSYLNLFPV